MVMIEAGDDKAWSVLVRRRTPAINAAVRKFDVADDLRADAIGEVGRVLFERLDTVRDPERLPGWVSVVASNQLTSPGHDCGPPTHAPIDDEGTTARRGALDHGTPGVTGSSPGRRSEATRPMAARPADSRNVGVNDPARSASSPPIWGDTIWATPKANVPAANDGP